jgi:hypothetical protein
MAEQSYGDWIRSNPPMPTKNLNTKHMAEQTSVFLSVKDKAEQFQKDLKSLLVKYDAELTIENFGRGWSLDEKIVVNFSWDEDLANRTSNGIIPDWVVGRWLNGN